MKIGVKVMPRKVVLDTQGRAVERTLSHHGYDNIQCKVGKYIEIHVDGASESEALGEAKKIAEFTLYNPLIEDYALEVLKD